MTAKPHESPSCDCPACRQHGRPYLVGPAPIEDWHAFRELQRMVLYFAPHMAGAPRTAASINGLLGLELVSDGDAIDGRSVTKIRDALEAKFPNGPVAP